MQFGAALHSVWLAMLGTRAIAVLVVLTAILINSGQGDELIASLQIDQSFRSWFVFLALLFWAAQSLLWARIALEAAPWTNETEKKLFGIDLSELLPPAYAFAIIVIATIPLFRAGDLSVASLTALSAFGLAGLAFYWARDRGRTLLSIGHTSMLGGADRFATVSINRMLRFDDAESRLFPHWQFVAMVSLIAAFAMFVLAFARPIWTSNTFGTLGVVFLALGVLTPIVNMCVIAVRKRRLPIVLGLLLLPFLLPVYYSSSVTSFGAWTVVGPALACILVFILVARRRYAPALVLSSLLAVFLIAVAAIRQPGPWITPHLVRSIDVASKQSTCRDTVSGNCQSTIKAEVDAWITRLGPAPKTEPVVVFVAAAGGGLRAGYWTAAVLARLDDCIEAFSKRVIAISGVSGGSLGAAAYAALVRDKIYSIAPNKGANNTNLTCRIQDLTKTDTKREMAWMQLQASLFLKGDFLAPVIGNFLFRDLGQSLVPLQLVPDRAVALELSLEQAWTDYCQKRSIECAFPDQFSQSFFAIRALDDKMMKLGIGIPALLLNGTHQETGKRVITSTVGITTRYFFDTFDFFALHNQEIALSTAILNSARFPIVSPAGALQRIKDGSAEPRGHIIDGGFFENNGAVTLQEFMAAALDHPSIRNLKARPLVIEIINDVESGEEDLVRTSQSDMGMDDRPLTLPISTTATTASANQLISAGAGLYATRTARGILASKSLSHFATKQHQGHHVLLRLCPDMNPSPPLGWLLTAGSRVAMDNLILGIEADQRKGLSPRYLRCLDELQNRLSEIARIFSQ